MFNKIFDSIDDLNVIVDKLMHRVSVLEEQLNPVSDVVEKDSKNENKQK